MNWEFIGRIVAWLAAVNAIVSSVILALTPLADSNPYVAKVIAACVIISGCITPFLPRAQGAKNPLGK